MLSIDLAKIGAKLIGLIYYRWRFAQFGKGSFIIKPIKILNPKYMRLGNNVRIRHHVRIEAIDNQRIPQLFIGDNSNIEQDVHIICSGVVKIGRSCSITARCAIVDTDHPFDIPDDLKIGEQLNKEAKQVVLGDGCFIGIGTVILPNVVLGKRCVVGANSVVTAGVYPDYSILAGSPARILRTAQPSTANN